MKLSDEVVEITKLKLVHPYYQQMIIIPYYQQWADKMIIFEWSIIIDKMSADEATKLVRLS